MPRGGRREGAGRPKGSRDSKPRGQLSTDAHRKNLQEVFAENFTADDLAEVVDDLKSRALDGHYKSAELLVSYGMGRPMVFNEVTTHAEYTGDQVRNLARGVRLLAKDGEVIDDAEDDSGQTA